MALNPSESLQLRGYITLLLPTRMPAPIVLISEIRPARVMVKATIHEASTGWRW
jgi:hypothetical protein